MKRFIYTIFVIVPIFIANHAQANILGDAWDAAVECVSDLGDCISGTGTLTEYRTWYRCDSKPSPDQWEDPWCWSSRGKFYETDDLGWRGGCDTETLDAGLVACPTTPSQPQAEENVCTVVDEENYSGDDNDTPRTETLRHCLRNIIYYKGAIEPVYCLPIKVGCWYGDEPKVVARSWATKHVVRFDVEEVLFDDPQMILGPSFGDLNIEVPDAPNRHQLIIDGNRGAQTDVQFKFAHSAADPNRAGDILVVEERAANGLNKLHIKNIIFHGGIKFRDKVWNEYGDIAVIIENCTFVDAGIREGKPAIPAIYVGRGWNNVQIVGAKFISNGQILERAINEGDHAVVFRGEGGFNGRFADGRSGIKLDSGSRVGLGTSWLSGGVYPSTHLVDGTCNAATSPPSIDIERDGGEYLLRINPTGDDEADRHYGWNVNFSSVSYDREGGKIYRPIYEARGDDYNVKRYVIKAINGVSREEIDADRYGEVFQLRIGPDDVDFRRGEELAVVSSFFSGEKACAVEQLISPRSWDTDGDGLSDACEWANDINPGDTDTDGDGLTDFEEAYCETNEDGELILKHREYCDPRDGSIPVGPLGTDANRRSVLKILYFTYEACAAELCEERGSTCDGELFESYNSDTGRGVEVADPVREPSEDVLDCMIVRTCLNFENDTMPMIDNPWPGLRRGEEISVEEWCRNVGREDIERFGGDRLAELTGMITGSARRSDNYCHRDDQRYGSFKSICVDFDCEDHFEIEDHACVRASCEDPESYIDNEGECNSCGEGFTLNDDRTGCVEMIEGTEEDDNGGNEGEEPEECPEGWHEVNGVCEPIDDEDDGDSHQKAAGKSAKILDDEPKKMEADAKVEMIDLLECDDGEVLRLGECVRSVESKGNSCAISDTRSFNIDALIPYIFLLIVVSCLRKRYLLFAR